MRWAWIVACVRGVGVGSCVAIGLVASGCGGDEPPPPPACEALDQADGGPAGLDLCGGSRYRPRAVECAPAGELRPCEASDLGVGVCTSDAACGEGEQCLKGVGDRCECVRPCVADDECGDGFACICALEPGEISRCLPAGCRSDADCEGDARCHIDQECVYGVMHRLECHGEDDECRGTFDCEKGTCRYMDEARWQCGQDCVQ